MCHVSRVDRSDSDIFETLQHACTWNIVFILAPDLFIDKICFKATLKSSGAETVVLSLKIKKGKIGQDQQKHTTSKWNISNML